VDVQEESDCVVVLLEIQVVMGIWGVDKMWRLIRMVWLI
jgi:hypothetical protein